MPVNLRKLSSLGPVNSFPIHSQSAETPRGCPRLKANFKGHAQEPAASSPPSEEEVDWPGDVVAMDDTGYRDGDDNTDLEDGSPSVAPRSAAASRAPTRASSRVAKSVASSRVSRRTVGEKSVASGAAASAIQDFTNTSSGKKCFGCSVAHGAKAAGNGQLGDSLGLVLWAFYVYIGIGANRRKSPSGIWCHDCVKVFLQCWAWMFLQKTLKERLAAFGQFLKTNPTQHIVHRGRVKVWQKFQLDGKAPVRPELLSYSVGMVEKLSDPWEAMLTVDAMKSALLREYQMEVETEQLQALKPAEFETPSGKKEKGFRLLWEQWMSSGREGVFPVERSKLTKKVWSYDLSKSPLLDNKQVADQFRHEQSKSTEIQNKVLRSFARFRGVLAAGEEVEELALDAFDEDAEEHELASELASDLEGDTEVAQRQAQTKPKQSKEQRLAAAERPTYNSVTEEYCAIIESIEAAFLNNEYYKTNAKAVAAIRGKGNWYVAGQFWNELKEDEPDACAVAAQGHLEKMYMVIRTAAKVISLNLKKAGGTISASGLQDISSFTNAVLAMAKINKRLSFEYVTLHFEAMAAREFSLNQSVFDSFKYVLMSQGETGLEQLASANGLDVAEIAYSVAALLFRRSLPGDFKGDMQIASPTCRDRCATLLRVCQSEIDPIKSIVHDETRVFSELRMILDVFDTAGDLESLMQKWDHAKGDAERSLLVQLLVQRGVANQMNIKLKAAAAERKSEKAQDIMAKGIEAMFFMKNSVMDWWGQLAAADVEEIRATLKSWTTAVPDVNKLVSARHDKSETLNIECHSARMLLQLLVLARFFSHAESPEKRITPDLVTTAFNLDDRLVHKPLEGSIAATPLPITEVDAKVMVDAVSVDPTDKSFKAAVVLQAPSQAKTVYTNFAQEATTWAKDNSLEHSLVDNLKDRVDVTFTMLDDRLVDMKVPLAAAMVEKANGLPKCEIAELQWDLDCPGMTESLCKEYSGVTAGTIIALQDEVTPFLKIPVVAEEIGQDVAEDLRMKITINLALVDIAMFQTNAELAAKKQVPPNEAFSLGKLARSNIARLLQDKEFKDLAEGKRKNVKRFFTHARVWISDTMGVLLESNLEGSKDHIAVLDANVPKEFEAMNVEGISAEQYFTESKKTNLQPLVDFKKKADVLVATGALATIEAKFDTELKLTGLPLETWADLDDQYKSFYASLKKGRACISSRAALKTVLDDDKDCGIVSNMH